MVVVLIPACNEESSIGGVVRDVDAVLGDAGVPHVVLVVDDGSRDGTAAALRGLAGRVPLEVLSFPENRGVGAVLQGGLDRALQLAGPEGAVAVLEGDGSNDPAALPGMLARLNAGADVVVASRFRRGGGSPGFPLRRWVLSATLAGLQRLAGLPRGLTDVSIFYRAYRAAALVRVREAGHGRLVTLPGFAANTELLLELLRLGARLDEVPLTYRYHLKRSASKMRIGREILDQLKLVARTWRGGLDR